MRTAILGASGLVGRTMLALLEDQTWLDQPPLLLSSARSAGREFTFRNLTLVCQDVESADLAGLDLALFSAGGGTSRAWAPRFVEQGAWVVDNSSAWRRHDDVALVVPEVNGRLVELTAGGGIIANPNCSTIQIALPCAVLHDLVGLQEAHVTTLQAASGAGQAGRDELAAQASDVAVDEQPGAEQPGTCFPRRLAANVIPSIGPLADNGFYEEEDKVHVELRKILAHQSLAVTCTATRVPVWNGHAAAVRAVLGRGVSCAEVVAAMQAYPGVNCLPGAGDYRTPAEISGDTDVHVGRIRHEPGRDDVILFWVVADNLLKGAAWNAVQIAARLAGQT